ncbi:MAG TPA: hypothetical protein VF103_05210 [Polyangiaceae bacterium]
MIPLVVIELVGPDGNGPYAGEMVAACSASLRQGECVLAPADAGGRGSVVSVARVTEEDELRFEIRVTRLATPSAPEASSVRVLEFQSVDAPPERWRSVGIGIASTAEALSGPTNGPPPAPRAKSERSSSSESDGARPFRLAGGIISGTGLDSGRVRLGGWLDGSARFGRRGPYVFGFGRYATAPAEHAPGPEGPVLVAPSFATFGLGAGFEPVSFAGLGMRLKAAGLAERFAATVTDASGAFVASDERWLPGALAAVEAAWPDTGLVGALLGAEVQGLTGATGIDLEGEDIGLNPAFRWGIFFGLEVRPRP